MLVKNIRGSQADSGCHCHSLAAPSIVLLERRRYATMLCVYGTSAC